MMTTILKIAEDDFDAALDAAIPILRSGGIIIYPTDTVYGIGGDATSENVVRKINGIKGSAKDKPLSVMVGDFPTIDYYCESGLWEDVILGRFLPGPYTFLLRRTREIAASKSGKLGIRFPDNAFCQYLCQKFGRPIVTTSANVSGNTAPTSFEEVDPGLVAKTDLAIDGGLTKFHRPSAVIDLVEKMMVRESGEKVDLLSELPER